MSRVSRAANLMNGKDWFNNVMLARAMELTTNAASQTMQVLRRSTYYDTEEKTELGRIWVRVIAVNGEVVAKTKDAWRLSFFGPKAK